MSTIAAGYDPTAINEWTEQNQPGIYMPMGLTAENVAKAYGITREEMDAFAPQSHQRAAVAQDTGIFSGEIIPVEGTDLGRGRKLLKSAKRHDRMVVLKPMIASEDDGISAHKMSTLWKR